MYGPFFYYNNSADPDSHEFLNGAINCTNWATSYETYAANFGNGVNYTVGTDDDAVVRLGSHGYFWGGLAGVADRPAPKFQAIV